MSPLGEEQQLQLSDRTEVSKQMRHGREADAQDLAEYDYLPVVSYAEAADKARLGPLLAKIREIANAATQLQKRVRIMLAKIQVDLMHDPVSPRNARVYEPRNKKELDDKRAS